MNFTNSPYEKMMKQRDRQGVSIYDTGSTSTSYTR